MSRQREPEGCEWELYNRTHHQTEAVGSLTEIREVHDLLRRANDALQLPEERWEIRPRRSR